jgi:hypothetical protein
MLKKMAHCLKRPEVKAEILSESTESLRIKLLTPVTGIDAGEEITVAKGAWVKYSNNIAFYEIRRETSTYNKYMKWHLLFYREDRTTLSSEWGRTRKEVEAALAHAKEIGETGFPIGSTVSYTTYKECSNDSHGLCG